MAIEKRWESISPLLLSADGTSSGVATLSSTLGFKVKQLVFLKATGEPTLQLQVKRVLSPVQLVLGPINRPLSVVEDISLYTVAKGASIEAPEQERPSIPDKEYERACFEEEPTVAKRTSLVDPWGQHFSPKNPIPVQLSDGSINIGTVNAELEVQLSHEDGDPDAGDVHDSVRIGGGQYEADVTADRELTVVDAKSLLQLIQLTATANANFLKLANYDQIGPAYSPGFAEFSYFEDQALVGKVAINFANPTSWDVSLEAYLNNDNGAVLEDDDGNALLME